MISVLYSISVIIIMIVMMMSVKETKEIELCGQLEQETINSSFNNL